MLKYVRGALREAGSNIVTNNLILMQTQLSFDGRLAKDFVKVQGFVMNTGKHNQDFEIR